MNTLIPMAGIGARFRDAGFSVPKPLIPVLGKPMYAWAVESLPLSCSRQTIFVLLRSQPEYEALRADILARYRSANPLVLSVPAPTAGQSATCLAARELINTDEPLCIHNADTAFRADPAWCAEALACGAEGGLLVFASQAQRWSYSREDAAGWVTEVREKKVISPWASTGTYWFRKGRDFVRLAEHAIATACKEGGEYYVGPLYNALIAEGRRVRNFPIQELFCFGTPEDLAATLPRLERALAQGQGLGSPTP